MTDGDARLIAIRIADWEKLYEVNDHGGKWTGKGTKARELEFVRWQVHGRGQGPRYRLLARAARTPQRLMNCYGTFGKLLEIAAQNVRELRGWVLDKEGRPCGAEDISFFAGFPLGTVEESVGILALPEVHWIELREVCADHFRKSPGIPGDSGDSGESAALHEPEPEQEQEQEPETRTRAGARYHGAVGGGAVGANGTFDARPFVSWIMALLGLPSPKRGTPGYGEARKQYARDVTTFTTTAKHIKRGDLGELKKAVLRCEKTAKQISEDKRVLKPAAVFQKRIAEKLAKGGLRWGVFPEGIE